MILTHVPQRSDGLALSQPNTSDPSKLRVGPTILLEAAKDNAIGPRAFGPYWVVAAGRFGSRKIQRSLSSTSSSLLCKHVEVSGHCKTNPSATLLCAEACSTCLGVGQAWPWIFCWASPMLNIVTIPCCHVTGASNDSAANEIGTGKATSYDWAIITGGSLNEQSETGSCRTGRPGPDEPPYLGGKCTLTAAFFP